MSVLIDKEYEEAIRFYLDKVLTSPDDLNEAGEDRLDLNVVKPFTKYITEKSPDKFLFSTPMFAWWNLTSACNLRCVHCLYNETEYTASNDLTAEEAMRVADELINDMGIVEVLLSGGEIFLRKDLLNIVKKFKDNNVAVKLMTNALLIQDKDIETLSELFNPYTDVVQISLDGATEKTFKSIRGTDNFEKLTANIKKLTSKGIRVTAVCTVNKLNINEVIETYKLAEKLGVTDFSAGKTVCYNESHKKLIVPARELMILASKLLKEKSSTYLKLALFQPVELLNIPEVEEIMQEEKYQKIIQKYTIDPPRSCNLHDRLCVFSDGNVSMCLHTDCKNTLLGNVRENSLTEIWQRREKNLFFQPRLTENMPCKACKYNKICNSGCMTKAYSKFGTINMPELECRHFPQ